MRGTDKVMTYALPVLAVMLGVFYYLANPLASHFPIRCVWQWMTGTQCPACGMQRALHALAHCHLQAALRYNYFLVLSVPYAALAVLSTWYNWHHALDDVRAWCYHRYTLRTYVCLYFLWWVGRNVLGV